MPFRIFQAQLSDLCSLQNSGDAPSAISDSVQGEVVESGAVPDESTLAQPVDTALSDENVQSAAAQPIDIEVAEPAMDEHLNRGDNSSGKQLIKPILRTSNFLQYPIC
jgi:tRNA (adenine-N(1)-)-methyltransferase non-catalytic subunit